MINTPTTCLKFWPVSCRLRHEETFECVLNDDGVCLSGGDPLLLTRRLISVATTILPLNRTCASEKKEKKKERKKEKDHPHSMLKANLKVPGSYPHLRIYTSRLVDSVSGS